MADGSGIAKGVEKPYQSSRSKIVLDASFEVMSNIYGWFV
jgi:hypothetical protein